MVRGAEAQRDDEQRGEDHAEGDEAFVRGGARKFALGLKSFHQIRERIRTFARIHFQRIRRLHRRRRRHVEISLLRLQRPCRLRRWLYQRGNLRSLERPPFQRASAARRAGARGENATRRLSGGRRSERHEFVRGAAAHLGQVRRMLRARPKIRNTRRLRLLRAQNTRRRLRAESGRELRMRGH